MPDSALPVKMSPFEILKKAFEKVKNGHSQPLEFYSLLWNRIVPLPQDEKSKVLEMSEQLSKINPFTLAYHNLANGMYLTLISDFANAISLISQSLEFFRQFDIKGGILCSCNMISICYKSVGQLDKAQNYIQQAMEQLDQVRDNDDFYYFKAVVCYQAGELSVQFSHYKNAIDHYTAGLKFIEGNPDLEGRLLTGLGVTYMHTGEWNLSIEHFNQALRIVEGKNHHLLESKILSDIGIYHFKRKEYDSALIHQLKSMGIRENNNLHSPLTTNYIQLAEIYLVTGKNKQALEYATKAVDQAGKLKTLIRLFEAHEILSKIYEEMGDIHLAFEHYKKYQKYKDEVHNQEVIRKVEQLNTRHKIESTEKENEIYRLRNIELKSALDEIKESFVYATRIQKAILPSDKLFRKFFPESFIMYKPKDIVAGDFYWLEEADGEVFIAACDCTGHGVPGAMVSVVCHNALNRSVREFGKRKASDILEKARDLIIEEFEKSEDDVKDGMDVVLCGIKDKSLQFSGANNPLWVINKNGFKEIKGNKQPVGKHLVKEPFDNYTLQLESGDCVYIFSDGFADQFGGPKGKKFRYSQLKDLMLKLHQAPMDEQKEAFNKSFDEWKGLQEQVDDVLLMGIRIL